MLKRIQRLEIMVKWLYCKVKNTTIGGIQSIVAGTNVTVDNTDPLNPVVSATGGGGGIQSVQAGTNVTVNNTDPSNPIVSASIQPVSATQSGIVNNISLQELGGVDKTINGVRVGRGAGNKENNLVISRNGLQSNTTGAYNVAIGNGDGTNEGVLQLNTTGKNNTGVGSDSLTMNTTGSNNDAFGAGSLFYNTVGTYNSAIGNYSLFNNTSGQWNTAMGASALNKNTTGQRNVAVSAGLFWNTSGSHNTALGMAAGYAGSTGSYNTYVGRAAGYDNGLGSYNVGVGALALIINGGGYSSGGSTVNMNRNVFVGSNLRGTSTMNDTLVIDNKGATITDAANALLYGGFSVANRFLKINGIFSVNPTYLNTADATYTKNIVAKADGTFGWEDKQLVGTTVDTISTISLSLNTLNTTYPTNSIGSKIYVTQTQTLYEKISATEWIQSLAVIVI